MREKMESKTGVESGFTGLVDEQDVGNYNLVNLNIQKILMRITTNYESGWQDWWMSRMSWFPKLLSRRWSIMRDKMESKTGFESGFTGLEDEQDIGNYNLVNLNIQKILMRITTNYESGWQDLGMSRMSWFPKPPNRRWSIMREKMESKTGVESGFTGLVDAQDIGNYNLVNLNIQKILMRITTKIK